MKVPVDGTTLEVLECGEGPEVVLVHGSGCDHRTWRLQRERWCDAFHLVTYSRRYHWPNRAIEPGAPYSLDQHVADLARLLQEIDVAPATLVGHSYGGVVGLVLAARRPELVRSLVLVEPPMLGLFAGVPPGPLELLKTGLRWPRTALGIMKLGATGLGPAAKALEEGDEEEALRRLGTAILGADAFQSLARERRAETRDNLIEEELTSPEALPRLDPEALASVACPVLLVGGGRSPAVFARFLDHLERLLPRAERMTIAPASHMVHADAPTAFHEAVESFVADGASS